MIWKGLLDLFAGGRASDVAPPWAAYQPVVDPLEDQARAALLRTGLCHDRDEDLAFVRAALDGRPFATGVDLRRHGTRLGSDELRSKGIRPTTIVTAEYLAILTPTGRDDPVGSAQVLTTAYQAVLAGTNGLGRALHVGITLVEVIPNNMAAGPCSACLALAGKPIAIAEAPVGPLPGCPHPTQCVIRIRSVLTFD